MTTATYPAKTLPPFCTTRLNKSKNRIEKVELDDILYIEGMKDYLRIHTLPKKIMTLQSFNGILQHLPEKILNVFIIHLLSH